MLREALIYETIQPPLGKGNIRSAGIGEMERAAAVIMLAFSTDPVARWVYPEPADYLRHFPEFIRGFAGVAFENRTALVTDDLAGAALWLPPGAHSDERLLMDLVEDTVSSAIREDLLLVMEAMSTYHPDEPHWYLPMIGVETRQQGRGIGAQLMRHALDRCDTDGIPAYLESSNPRNISLYERCGFVGLGTIQFGNSAPLFPMVRWPR